MARRHWPPNERPSAMKIKTEVRSVFVFVSVICSFSLFASPSIRCQDNSSGQCASPGLEQLTSPDFHARLRQTAPIDPPCCARNLNLRGTLVVKIEVGETGDTTCAEYLSGDPLLATPAIRSVRNWKFKPYTIQGHARAFSGQLAIKFHAIERTVTFRVVEATSTPTTH